MQNNRKLQISTAGSRKSMQWPRCEIMWSEFTEKLKTPIRGTETLEPLQGTAGNQNAWKAGIS